MQTTKKSLDILRKRMLKEAASRTKTSLTRRDRLLIHAINASEELARITNVMELRKKEWFDVAELTNAPDLQMKDTYEKGINEMKRLSEALDQYIEALAMELLPNTVALIPPKVAAKLLSRAGSLEKLAKMPASTIQVLGAEKALFKHLRKKTKPPKHGILFQVPLINHAPKEVRGKLARFMAGKVAIAVRTDCFSKRDIRDTLLSELNERTKGLHSSSSQLSHG